MIIHNLLPVNPGLQFGVPDEDKDPSGNQGNFIQQFAQEVNPTAVTTTTSRPTTTTGVPLAVTPSTTATPTRTTVTPTTTGTPKTTPSITTTRTVTSSTPTKATTPTKTLITRREQENKGNSFNETLQ